MRHAHGRRDAREMIWTDGGRGGEDRPEALSCRAKRAPLGDYQPALLTLCPYSPSLGETAPVGGREP
jgi:hypothetical protein